MDKLSELNKLIEDMEAVADKYYRKIKEESSNYLEVKEKCTRVAKAIAYRDSPIGEFLKRRWEKDYFLSWRHRSVPKIKNNLERGEKVSTGKKNSISIVVAFILVQISRILMNTEMTKWESSVLYSLIFLCVRVLVEE